MPIIAATDDSCNPGGHSNQVSGPVVQDVTEIGKNSPLNATEIDLQEDCHDSTSLCSRCIRKSSVVNPYRRAVSCPAALEWALTTEDRHGASASDLRLRHSAPQRV